MLSVAFVRWDGTHLHAFEFPVIGKRATEHRYCDVEDPDSELDADQVRVGDVAQEFSYTFDLGDNWRHHRQVGKQPIDPAQELGVIPDMPLPYWGWGTIPDPNGRMWDGDDGDSPAPATPHKSWPWANAHSPTLTTLHCPGQYTQLTATPHTHSRR
ncbi:hypothetical protein AB0M29_31275 [Streptomyces sp. NPDC051976]|uniref:IS1096 element passenger TnpR family protein n=1 Tax=Streptomyces sp. NPDC051976 TaxID=3154947 RepID=UPI0034358E96